MAAGQVTVTFEAGDEPLLVNVPANGVLTAGQALDIVRSARGPSGTLRDQAGAFCPPEYQLQAGSIYTFMAARGGSCVCNNRIASCHQRENVASSASLFV